MWLESLHGPTDHGQTRWHIRSGQESHVGRRAGRRSHRPANSLSGYLDGVIIYENKLGFPFIATISFWVYKQATPGKMTIKVKIVDAKTGGKPTLQQFIIRFLGYFVAVLPLGLGIVWVAWDSRKQGWHDKMAGTLVVKEVNPL